MTDPILILKKLHCRGVQVKKLCDSKRPRESFAAQEGPRSKLNPKTDQKKSNTCRVCLKEGNIYIFGSNVTGDISEALRTFGDIELLVQDPFPKFLCQSCNSLLQGAVILRKIAKESDEILRQNAEKFVEDNKNNISIKPDVQNHDENNVKLEGTIEARNNDLLSFDEKRIHNIVPKAYQCKRCDLSFNYFKQYDKHLLTDEHKYKKYTCPVCFKTFNTTYYRKHLNVHKEFKLLEGQNDNFTCMACNKTFETKLKYSSHMRSHQTPKTYMCDICGETFKFVHELKRHNVIKHLNILPYKCSLCPYRGSCKDYLRMHMRSHTGERPYQCTQCPSRFISQSNLSKHSLIHKTEFQFKCDACGRGFHKKLELEYHYKSQHMGIKDFVCSDCGKGFGHPRVLRKHEIQVHKRKRLRSGIIPTYLRMESMNQQCQDYLVES